MRPDREAILLHGIRNMKTLQEEEPEPVAKEMGWECVPTVAISSVSQVLEACQALNPVKNGETKHPGVY